MADYRLTQSGDEVQSILNNSTPQSELAAETERAQGAEQTLQGNINTEAQARQDADTTLQGKINTVSDNLAAEVTRAKAAEKANADDIDVIEGKIPAAASSSNKLADQQFVNSSIQTATAEFKGTFNLVSDLHLTVSATRLQIAAALPTVIASADNNDYAFVMIPTADATPTEIASVERYKFNGSAWAFEYALNNSGFTQAQWNALNSGITSGLVAKLGALPTAADLAASLLALQGNIDAEETRAKAAEQTLTGNLAAEVTRAQGAEGTLQTNLNTLGGRVTNIESKIPVAATDQNQLADKAFVNSSIQTATAEYKGSYNEVSDLNLTVSATRSEIAVALSGVISGANNNDYAFVQIPVADATPTEIARVERYKFNGSAWAYEYTLNNSGFTADQWTALNSGITSGLVAKLNLLPSAAELTTLLGGKQDVISDLAAIRTGAGLGATAYQKPGTGIPNTDLSSGVQTSLGKAETAYQEPVGGIPETDLSAELQAKIASFITQTVTNLVNYYLKSETYSAAQVDALIATVKQFQYTAVSTLPTASADTMGIIYLVPGSSPKQQNVKDEYITLSMNEGGETTYYWEMIGQTTIDLSNYYTKSQTDAAITAALNAALTDYATTTQVGTMISTAINTALAQYYNKTQVDNIANTKTDKLTMTGEGAAVKDDIMVVDENGNIKDGGKNISDLQLKVTDCAMLGGGFPTCATAGGTAAKTVTISNFLLLTNCRISVLFQNAFTASNPTLSINGGTAIAIKHFGRAMEIGKVHANTILTMVYDGTYWQVIGIESMTGSTPSGAVDLALPSGLLWCEHNVGAASPYDDGLYFSWGNVEGHTGTDGYDFGTSNDGPYASTPGAALTGNISVDGTYDAARHNMGAPWRMPTQPEFQELNDNCTSEWTDEDGVAGRRFTSNINGNSIFFPAAGNRYGTGLLSRGTSGNYWSSSLNSQADGYNLGFNSGGVNPANTGSRFLGFSVRAVQ